MRKITHVCLVVLASFAFGNSNAETVSKDQIKGLDEQVQDIKKDVLDISAELNLLEEKLLFPSNTQISLFVSLDEDAGFSPDAIKINIDGKDIASHVYSFREVESMKKGGVQRIYTGNVRSGDHDVEVAVTGTTGAVKNSDTSVHTINKGVGPKFVEIRLTESGAEFLDW